jgi:hypothetical protein
MRVRHSGWEEFSSWAEIEKIWEPYASGIPLRREYDANERAIIYRIQQVPEIPPHWPLLIGDVLHNLRCVCDHLAWQLAIRFHNGNEPSERDGRNVQFPVVTNPSEWTHHRHTQQMLRDDRDFLERMQPYHSRGPNSRSGLLDLALMSNYDKHRLLHVVAVGAGQATYTNTVDFRDCLPDRRAAPNGDVADIVVQGIGVLKPDLEIARVFVLQLDPTQTMTLKLN